MCKENLLISIIVPVYNVAQYLDRCVISLVDQTYKNIEIILVNDGSEDECPQMCDMWKKRDKRIQAIHKSNGGLGDARNAGMMAARGNWIAFVDPDDYVDITTYEKCMAMVKNTPVEVCYFGSVYVTHKGKHKISPVQFPKTLKKEEIRQELLPKCYGHSYKDLYTIGSACMGIYKAELIRNNHVHFVSEKKWISEDYIFTADICYLAEEIAFVPEALYYYCENEFSLTHTYRQDRFEKAVRLYNNRKEDIRKKNLNKEALQRAAARLWDYFMGAAMDELCYKKAPVRSRYIKIVEMCRHPVIKQISNSEVIRCLRPRQRAFVKAVRYRCMPVVLLMIYIRTR